MVSKSLTCGLRTKIGHNRTLPPYARSIASIASQTTTHTRPSNPPRPLPRWASTPTTVPPPFFSRRAYSNPSTPAPTTPQPPPPNTPKQPSYELTFTCVPCGSRSAHTISKQGYHHGSILITCPSCRNRHVISDHLQIFGHDTKVTVEELAKQRGRLVKRGTLGEDGDLEFWEDGTTTVRSERQGDADGQDPKVALRKVLQEAEAEAGVAGSTFNKTR